MDGVGEDFGIEKCRDWFRGGFAILVELDVNDTKNGYRSPCRI